MRSRSITNLIFLVLVTWALPGFTQGPGSYVTDDYQGSEILFFTPWSVFEKTLSSYAGPQKNFRRDIASTNWNIDQYRWNLSGISLESSASFDTNQSPGRLNFTSNNSSINVTVQSISIRQYVERVVNGVLIRVWVEAECGPLRLRQTSAQMSGQIAYQFNEQNVSTRLEQFNLQWPAQSWTIDPIRCSGPQGFPELLQQNLQENLRSASIIQPWAQEAFAVEIQNQVNILLEKIKAPAALPVPKGTLPLQITFLGFTQTEQGLITRAQAVWDTSRANPRIRPLSVTTLPQGLPKQKASLIFGEAGLRDLALAEIENLPAYTRLTLNDQPEFQKLLKSCLGKLFLWPDLLAYNAKSPFYLLLGRPQVTDARWLNSGSLQISFTEGAWIQSFRKDQWWYYLYLQANTQGVITPKISQGRMTLTAQAAVSPLRVGWGEDYVNAFRPNRHIADSVVEELVKQLNRQLSFQFTLPTFDLGPGGVARAESWLPLEQDLIAIPLRIL